MVCFWGPVMTPDLHVWCLEAIRDMGYQMPPNKNLPLFSMKENPERTDVSGSCQKVGLVAYNRQYIQYTALKKQLPRTQPWPLFVEGTQLVKTFGRTFFPSKTQPGPNAPWLGAPTSPRGPTEVVLPEHDLEEPRRRWFMETVGGWDPSYFPVLVHENLRLPPQFNASR